MPLTSTEANIKYDERVQKILRDMDDSSSVVYCTEEPLYLHRHNSLKKVFLVSTLYHLYLIKAKDMSFYARWPNRLLSVKSSGKSLFIGTADSTQVLQEEQQPPNSSLALLSAEQGEDEEFRFALLEANTANEIEMTEQRLRRLAESAAARAEQLANEERGAVENEAQEAQEKEEEWGDAESDGSDEDASFVWRRRPTLLQQQQREGEVGGLFHKTPSRYLAVTSLVDGDFTDYNTLKNAYLRKEEEALQEDLAAFIKENEGQVEKLCKQHYPAFLHAARQCFFISEKDAEVVGQELGGATELARSSVMEIKRAAADLNLSRCVQENVAQVVTLLHISLEVAERLETVERCVCEGRLIGAVVSLKQLVRIVVPLAEYTLGEYVIHYRVPQLTKDIFTAAVHEFNAWLKLLRELSLPVGVAASEWEGVVQPGTLVKRLHVSEEGDWWVERSYVRASIRRAPFGEANGIADILYGTSLQEVFEGLDRGSYYRSYYAESRAQQAKLDVYEVPLPSEKLTGEELVVELRRYCQTALGFILIEDIVHNVTEPHVQSTAEILCMWEELSQAIANHTRRAFALLVNDSNYTARMMDIFCVLRSFVNIAVESVRSVQLSPVTLLLVVEAMNNNIISSWLQEACVEATQSVLNDTLAPLHVTSKEEYDAYVRKFYLDRCKFIEIPLPSYEFILTGVELPYAQMVPLIGDTALRFLSRCNSIMVTDNGAVARQSEVNNVDDMLLKYISVLFRTVAELLQGHLASVAERAVMQLAVYVTSCAAMSVILSCVEQQFVLAWPSDYGEKKREKLGVPRLLASSAALFEKALQKSIERLLAALVAETEERLRPTADIEYWKRLVECRSHGAVAVVTRHDDGDASEAGEEGGFIEAMDYIIAVIPRLKEVLQTSVLRSVTGTVLAHAAITIETNLERAIHSTSHDGSPHDFALLRSCVKEFELLCTAHLPTWQKRIDDAVDGGGLLVQRFPLQPKRIADNHMTWITRKEATLAHRQ